MPLQPGLVGVVEMVVTEHDTAPAFQSGDVPVIGSDVKAEALLEAVQGRRLTFRVSVTDERGLVAAGKITRVVVERERFLEKAVGG